MRFPDEIDSLYQLLDSAATVEDASREVALERARSGETLTLEEAAILLTAPSSWEERIFESAADLNRKVNGKVVTFYGVVYIHDFCKCHCTYCGDSIHAASASRTLLTKEQFFNDVETLLHHHPLKEICFLMGEDWLRFNREQLIDYLQAITPIYKEKIILNIPPLSINQFKQIRAALPDNRLHFRVFQETYDRDIYSREHLAGPKKDFDWRIPSQARALEAGFDEAGHGVLYGLNDKPNGHFFETLAMIAHARQLYEKFGKRSQSMSFPRVLPAPDIDYHPAASINDATLKRCISVMKLAEPNIDAVITCREEKEFRRQIRPIVNIEDFAARPGPGGNSNPEVRQQMVLPDMRSGEEVKQEMEKDGYEVR